MKESDFTIATREDWLNYITRPDEDVPQTELVPGSVSYLVASERMTISFIHMKAGTVFDLHSHDQEQVMIVVEGYCDEVIGDKIFRVEKGDVIRLPANVKHGAFLRDVDCKAIDIFVPRREDFHGKFRTQNPEAILPFDFK
ncbi:MAG: cupin domain-containing protein [Oscillospiraceae bacterium]|nr:cupin domain-containing protein [Oscillospiraceae bacterium]